MRVGVQGSQKTRQIGIYRDWQITDGGTRDTIPKHRGGKHIPIKYLERNKQGFLIGYRYIGKGVNNVK